MRILLHVCCGPCALYPVSDLRTQGHEVTAYFYNPNVHPYREYKQRQTAVVEMSRQLGLPLIMEENYFPERYFREIVFREDKRCWFCYHLRLREVAAFAKEKGFEGFTTTLLVSPWQKHELIRETGDQMARDEGVPFLYFDWRSGYQESRCRAKEMGLYSQQYCGCLFSERERFRG